MSYKYIGDNKSHYSNTDMGYMVVTEIDHDLSSSLMKFLSDHSDMRRNNLTIRVYIGDIGSSFIIYDNTNQCAVADITDYNNW